MGQALAASQARGRWRGAWRAGTAFPYGQMRQVEYEGVPCLWRVLGHDVVVKAAVARVEGYRQRFTLVTSATDLSGLRMAEPFRARFRQEGAFRDLKQRPGWEEGRAWARNPIERTARAVLVTLTASRPLQLELQGRRGDDWWLHPPWNPRKTRPSVLGVERLLRERREESRRGLAEWLGNEGNTGG